MRVLKWIVDRVNGKVDAAESPFGQMPRHQDLNWRGLDFHADDFSGIMDIDRGRGLEEADSQKELFDSFEDRLPPEMETQRQALKNRLAKSPDQWQVAS